MTLPQRPNEPILPKEPPTRAEVADGSGMPLCHSRRRRLYRVVAVAGDDALAKRLAAFGVWAGAMIERLGQAPFGDPLLFRLHGFRLALRASEAARVTVVEAA